MKFKGMKVINRSVQTHRKFAGTNLGTNNMIRVENSNEIPRICKKVGLFILYLWHLDIWQPTRFLICFSLVV